MHKKLGSLIAIACLSASLAVAQSGTRPASEQVTSVSWGLQNPPLPVASGSVALVGGQPGNATYYFWVVANYLIGSAQPAGPFLLANGPNRFSATNYANLSWAAAPGAISYDVLLTTAPSAPTGACGCAVATGVANTSVQVQTNSLIAYTVTAVDASAYTIGSQNVQSALGISTLKFTLPDGTVLGSLDTTGGLTVNSCVGCGSSSNLSSPPPIGNTTPNTVNATVLTSADARTANFPVMDLRAYGLVGDGTRLQTCNIASGQEVVTCTGSAFSSADVGKGAFFAGAGASGAYRSEERR